jgi:DNA-binding CsgD family transcriptional regulator
VVELGAVEEDLRALDWAGTAANYLGRADLAQEAYARAVAVARGVGAAATLAVFLHVLATTEAWLGRPTDAEADATEALALARETHQDGIEAAAQGLLALLFALRGDEDACRDAAERALAVARPRGLALAASASSYALGLLDLGQGRPAEAVDRFAAIVTRSDSHPIYRLVTVPDFAEAAARAGRPDLARGPLETFAAWAAVTRAPWSLAATERTRALLGPPEEAEARLREALRLDASPLYRARTELLLGEHLRRARRTTDARPHLRAAREAFAQLGAAPWAARAATELRATGETVRRRDEGGLSELTPQELQITRLVAGGATNREVAAQLFVSPKTVEYHLGKVFTKLGVASRTELAAVTLAAA